MNIQLANQLIEKCGVYGYTFFMLDDKEYGITYDSTEDGYITHTVHPLDIFTTWQRAPWTWAINSKFVDDKVTVIDVEAA